MSINTRFLGTSLFAIAGAVASLPSAAYAQAGAAPQAAEDENTGGLEEILVTARKTSENVQDVPIAISAFSAQRLEDLNLRTVNEIAYQTPGFTAVAGVASPHGPQFQFRGQAQTDVILTQDAPVGVYLDGVYLPRSLGLTAALVDIERIEVLKGPQGTLFGKNTTGGAISITTRRPDLDVFSGYGRVYAGNRGAYGAEAMLNVPFATDQAALRIVGSYSKDNGNGIGGAGQRLGADEDYYVRAELLLKPKENISVLLTGDYTDLHNSGDGLHLSYTGNLNDLLTGNANAAANGRANTPGNYLALLGSHGLQSGLISGAQLRAVLTPPSSPNFNPAAFGAALPAFFAAEANLRSLIGPPTGGSFWDSRSVGPEDARFTSKGVSGTLTVESGDITVKSITAHREYKRVNSSDLDGVGTILLAPAELQQDPKVFTQEFQLVKNTGRGLDWLLGAYYSNERGTDTSVSSSLLFVNPNNPGITYGRVSNKSLAFFAQGKYKLSDQFNVTAGIRYTEETKSLVSRNRTVIFDLTQAVTAGRCNIVSVLATPGICESFPIKSSYNAWDYLFSLDFKLTDDILLYAKTARGFKSGGQNLRGQDAATLAPFGPETITEYEIGAKIEFLDRRVRLNLAAYTDKDEDLQRTVILLGPGGNLLTVTTNAASARVNGFEADLAVAPTDSLTLFGTLSYTDAKYNQFTDRSGPGGTLRDRSNESFGVPKWTYSIGATYAAPIGNGELRTSVNWAYRSTQQLQPNALAPFNLPFVSQPSYGLLGGRIAYKHEGSGIEVGVYGSNILNKEYYAGGITLDSALGIIARQPGSPATFGADIKFNF